MARVTAILASLAFLFGCITFTQGLRAGHGDDAITTHLYWGFATLILQLFAAGVAFVHSRAGGSGDGPSRGGLESGASRD
jgi:hypothetical protein